MSNVLNIRVTSGGFTNEHDIILPSESPVNNPNDLKVKFYNRGSRSNHYHWSNPNPKPPRNDTQIYINNKYFFVINSILAEDVKENITDIIQYCYMYGLSIEEIKGEFKKMYGRV